MIYGQIKPAFGTPLNRNHWAAQGLVAQYLFNEGCGDVVHDSCGMNDGKIIGSSPMISVPTAGGTVTQANMRLSCVAGTAFVDFGAADVLTGNIGKLIRITSVTTGLFIEGWIKAAGTGETLSNNLFRDPSFDDVTKWTNPDSAWTVSGGQATCAGVTGSLQDLIPATVLTGLYKRGITIASRVSGNVTLPYNGAGINLSYQTSTSLNNYWTMNSTGRPVIYSDLFNGVVDSVQLEQVLTPSTTGATIVSTRDGSTYSWATQQTGFNYNDTAGYTYSFPQSGWVSSPQGGGLAFDGSNDYVVTNSFGMSGTSVTLIFTVNSTPKMTAQTFISDFAQGTIIGYIWAYRDSLNSNILVNQYANGTYTTCSTNHFFLGYNNINVTCAIVTNYANKTMVFYRNGILFSQHVLSGTPVFPETKRKKYFGAYNTGSMHLNHGDISFVSIYNRALSAEEIKYLYTFPYCAYDNSTPAWVQKDYGREARLTNYYQQMGGVLCG